MNDASYRGWVRPGPIPPGGVDAEPGETLDYLCGHFRIFQYERGHRYSTDDVLTAWYATQWAPRVDRAADIGSGIGSVAMIAAWRLPGAHFYTVEAQEISIRLARKSVAFNGLADRFRLYHGDLRDPSILAGKEPFDLVTGSPLYFPEGTASRAAHDQAVPARIEVRGSVHDYATAAAKLLRAGGVFAFVFPTPQAERARAALAAADLVLLRSREVIFKAGEPSLISLFLGGRAADLPVSFTSLSPGKPWTEPPLIIRDRDGRVHPEYATIRLSFGFPPGDVGAGD
ncbi:MAG: methyltransferase [Acidobacteria bacterium]|nr:methyltransferase [Acidobacteriota bacterium]